MNIRYSVQSDPSYRGNKRTKSLGTSGITRESCVVALIENKSREVGIAAMNNKSSEVSLVQFADNHSYIHTLLVLQLFEPSEFIMSKTSEGSSLFRQCLEIHFELVPVSWIGRNYFDETRGFEIYKQAHSGNSGRALDVSTKYICLAALNSLVKFVELTRKVHLPPNCLKITVCHLEDILVLDYHSIVDLELLADTRKGKAADSFFGCFTCRTAVGARMLRQSIMQPFCNTLSIESRLSCLSTFLDNESLFFEIQRLLPMFSDIDGVASKFVSKPKTIDDSWTKDIIKSLIQLRKALGLTQCLSEAISDVEGSCGLLNEIKSNLSLPAFEKISTRIEEVIDEDVFYIKDANAAKHSILFSVKKDLSPMLDLAKQAWLDHVEMVQKHFQILQEEAPNAGLKLEYNVSQGFYVSFPLTKASKMSDIITHVSKKGGKFCGTTDTLTSLNARIKDITSEILTHAASLLGSVVDDLRSQIQHLYALSYAVGFLDMMVAFAGYVTMQPQTIRPTFDDNGPIAIRGGVNPMSLRDDLRDDFVPFDYYMHESSNLQIITGPNGVRKMFFF
eukprot:GHVL01007848.1.p1 GENE.GHVL01007848.1~~GHVL01007848.1.p1  ORF type:complete len:562 (+),score=69.12 GHVL01007848.1:555-2240(+)